MATHVALSEDVGLVPSQNGRGGLALALRYAGVAFCALSAIPFARSFALPLAWLALANLMLAHAYAFNRVSLFGKRPDGSMAPLRVLLLLPYLILLWGFFLLKLLGLRREPCWHEAAPGLYIGRRPSKRELPSDCRMVVDLTSEFIEARAVVSAHRYRCLPILNRHVPSDLELEQLLLELIAFEGAIYVHCGAGRGRSAMLVAALLVLRGHAASVDQAENELKALRPGVHLHPAQRALIGRQCDVLLLRRAAARQNPAPSATTMCA